MCTPASETKQMCVWRVRYHHLGYRVLAVAGEIKEGNKLRMDCTLPVGTKERSAPSCHIGLDG